MNKEKLTSRQFACLFCFPLLALFSGIGTHNIIEIAKVDSYLSVGFSYLLGILPLVLFLWIFNYKKDLNIHDKINDLFGPILGTILNWISNVLILCIGIILIYNISNFAISQFLAETPIVVFMVLLGIIIVYNVSLGIENIARVAIIFLSVICLLTFISTSGILPHFEMSNIKPFLEKGLIRPLQGSIILTLTNVVPIFMLLMIPQDKVEVSNKFYKHSFFFYTLAFLFMFLAILLTMGALGIHLSSYYQYPEYTVLKKISLFNFIDRIENFIYVKWILNSIMCLTLVVYYLQQSIKKTSTKLVPVIITGLLIYFSITIFKNNTTFYMISMNVFPYVCLLLFVIYLIIGLNILIRKIIEH